MENFFDLLKKSLALLPWILLIAGLALLTLGVVFGVFLK